jgi:hypothetical protein
MRSCRPDRAMSASDLLLATGVSLAIMGVMLRGFHQSQKRSEALRSQTARLARLDGREDTLNPPASAPHFLARHLPLIYRGLVLVGAIIALAGFWLR